MLKVLALAGSLFVVSVSAWAQMPGHGGGHLKDADANGDSLVTREEFVAAREAQFAKRDRNEDGYLDESDMSKRAASRRRREAAAGMQEQLDSDADGKISKQEFVDGSMSMFERMDADKSGTLEAQEREDARAAMKERVRKMRTE